MSYFLRVKSRGSWQTASAMRFATEGEAKQFASGIAVTWTRLREWKMPKGITIMATPLPANAVFKDGRARARRGLCLP